MTGKKKGCGPTYTRPNECGDTCGVCLCVWVCVCVWVLFYYKKLIKNTHFDLKVSYLAQFFDQNVSYLKLL